MTDEVKGKLVEAIWTRHPGVSVRTTWSAYGRDHAGLELYVPADATGIGMCAQRTDAQLDAMTYAEVMAWVLRAVGDYRALQHRAWQRLVAERRIMERRNRLARC